MRRGKRPSAAFTDDELICFVRWCRLNDDRIVDHPQLCRNVMDAYAGFKAPKQQSPPEHIPTTNGKQLSLFGEKS